MAQGIAATYGQLISTVWIYIASGTLWCLARIRKVPVLAALYPIAMLFLELVLAALCAVGLGAELYAFVSPWVATLGLLPVPIVLQLFRKFVWSFFAYYLMHDYAFWAQ